jgi:acyl-CoA synthetase
VTREGEGLVLAEVQRHFSAAGVAKQKTPEALFLVDEFPRTASGKVRKADLRQRLAAMP